MPTNNYYSYSSSANRKQKYYTLVIPNHCRIVSLVGYMVLFMRGFYVYSFLVHTPLGTNQGKFYLGWIESNLYSASIRLI